MLLKRKYSTDQSFLGDCQNLIPEPRGFSNCSNRIKYVNSTTKNTFTKKHLKLNSKNFSFPKDFFHLENKYQSKQLSQIKTKHKEHDENLLIKKSLNKLPKLIPPVRKEPLQQTLFQQLKNLQQSKFKKECNLDQRNFIFQQSKNDFQFTFNFSKNVNDKKITVPQLKKVSSQIIHKRARQLALLK